MSSAPAGGATPPSGVARVVAPVLAEVIGGAARRLRARLSARTGREMPVRTSPARITTVAELVAAGPADDGLWCSFPLADAEPGTPPALVIVDHDLLPALVAALFGAPDGDPADRYGRGTSEVERVVGTRICRELVESVIDGWAGGPVPRLVAGETAASPRVCEGVDPEARYVVIEIVIGAALTPLGSLAIALPASLVPGALPAPRPPRPAPVESPPRFERLLPIQLELVAELGRLSLPLRQLRELVVGDEIPLRLSGDALGRVADRLAVTGEAGSCAGVRSLRVTGRANSSSSPGTADR